MQVLALNLDYLTFLGIMSKHLDEPTNEFLKTFQSWFFFCSHFTTLLVFSLAYLYYNFSDLSTSTNAMIVFFAGITCFVTFLSIGMEMKTSKILYRELQSIVDKGVSLILSIFKIASLNTKRIFYFFFSQPNQIQLCSKSTRKPKSVVIFIRNDWFGLSH